MPNDVPGMCDLEISDKACVALSHVVKASVSMR